MIVIFTFFLRKTKEKEVSINLLTRTRENHLQQRHNPLKQEKKDRFVSCVH